MASHGSDSDGRSGAAHGPRECMACRGSGQVISNLGGSPRRLTCPWCGGEGVRLTGVDAQAAWLEQQGGAADPSGEPAA